VAIRGADGKTIAWDRHEGADDGVAEVISAPEDGAVFDVQCKETFSVGCDVDAPGSDERGSVDTSGSRRFSSSRASLGRSRGCARPCR